MLRPTILVVDDEVNMLQIMSRTLADIGHVRTASSVFEARNILSQVSVDVCLCDYHIGDECMTDVLAISPLGIKFIGMSASPRCDCPLPSHHRDMPWLEKGGGIRLEKVRLAVMEAIKP